MTDAALPVVRHKASCWRSGFIQFARLRPRLGLGWSMTKRGGKNRMTRGRKHQTGVKIPLWAKVPGRLEETPAPLRVGFRYCRNHPGEALLCKRAELERFSLVLSACRLRAHSSMSLWFRACRFRQMFRLGQQAAGRPITGILSENTQAMAACSA